MNPSVRLDRQVYQDLRAAIVGALKDAVRHHGPITNPHLTSSEVKRAIGMVWGTLANAAKRQQPMLDADEVAGILSSMEDIAAGRIKTLSQIDAERRSAPQKTILL